MYGKNEIISLITRTVTKDADGFPTYTDTKTDIFADVKDATGTEFSQMGALNITPEYSATVWIDDYDGETLVEYKNRRYAVYRTYQPNVDEIELKLKRAEGEK